MKGGVLVFHSCLILENVCNVCAMLEDSATLGVDNTVRPWLEGMTIGGVYYWLLWWWFSSGI